MPDQNQKRLLQRLIRDGLLFTAAYFLWHATAGWYTADPYWLPAILIAVFSFSTAYAACYIMHEWGHYFGARLSGANIPVAPVGNILLGLFDPRQHTVRQFQWMSLGGVAAYTITAILFAVTYQPALPLQALTLGGVAFVAQSWSVDLPIIWRVQRGAPVLPTATDGAAPQVIGRRTLQSWSLLAAAVAALALV